MCFKPFKGPSLISPYFKNEKKISNENFTKQKKRFVLAGTGSLKWGLLHKILSSMNPCSRQLKARNFLQRSAFMDFAQKNSSMNAPPCYSKKLAAYNQMPKTKSSNNSDTN